MEADWQLRRQQEDQNQTVVRLSLPFLLPLHRHHLHHHHRSLYLREGIIQHNNNNNILDHGLITEMTPISAATTITILLYDPKQQQEFIA
jgi:hypothetical protein